MTKSVPTYYSKDILYKIRNSMRVSLLFKLPKSFANPTFSQQTIIIFDCQTSDVSVIMLIAHIKTYAFVLSPVHIMI